MSSTLSIRNDTNETVYVKVGSDEAALGITAIIGAVIGALSSVVVPAAGAMAGSVIIQSSALLNFVSTAAAIQSTVTTIVLKVQERLVAEGFTKLYPGQVYTSGRKTLSLWQQCHVVRVEGGPSRTVVKETYMRPIFTGATHNSNIQHDISFWVNRYPWRVTSNIPVVASEQAAFHPGSYIFTSFHGNHLSSGPDGRVWLTPNRDAWEIWTPVHLGDSKYAWKSIAHQHYLRADPNGSVNTAPHIREWETWTHTRRAGGNVWRSHHGTYLRARSDGGVDLAPHAREWEHWN